MRLLLLSLFLISFQLFADGFRQALLDNCQSRPAAIFLTASSLEEAAMRGNVEGQLSASDFFQRARDEYGCADQVEEIITKWAESVIRSGWQSEIRPRLTTVSAKLGNVEPVNGYEELREARDEIAHFAGKLGKESSEFIDLEEVDGYIAEGIDTDLSLLLEQIKEQAKYRDPSALIQKLEEIARRENRIDVLLSARRKARLIADGQEAQSERKRSCTNVNNIREPLRYDNARNQDEIGWCFAFAGADMVAHKLGVMVSPVDMALNHNNVWLPGRMNQITGVDSETGRLLFNRETDLEGGFSGLAINETRKKGFCPENLIPENAEFVKKHHDYIGVLRSLEDFYDESHSSDIVHGCMDSELRDNCEALLPNLPIDRLLYLVANTSRIEFLDKVIDENCQGHRLYLPEDLRVHSKLHMLPFSRKHLWNSLDEQLEKGNVASMVYSENILHDHRDFTDPIIDGHHVSVVAGRRFNEATGSCEYLIRNSHGDWCAGYDSKYECVTGHIWVGEQYLNRSLQTISYLE